MKRTILIFISVFFIFNTNGQESKIDSLEIVLTQKQSASEKNEIYKKLCKELNRIAHPDKSISIYLKALSNAQKTGDSKFEARINRYLFKAHKHIGKNDLALKYIIQALDIDKTINNINGILLDINLLGTYYIDTQNNKKAIEVLNQGINYYNEKDSINTICVIHTNLGIAYLENGNLEKAVQYYIKAIEYSEKLKSFEDKNFALHQLGVAYMLQGNYKKAKTYFLESLKDSIHNKYPAWRNANHHALAFNYWCMKDYRNSIKHGKISEEFNHKTGNAYQEFEDIRYQVQSYNYLGEYENAIEAGKRALQLENKITFTDLIYAIKVNISTSYLFSEKYDEAEKYLLEVLLYINNKKEVKRINKQRLYKNLSILYEKKHKFDKALIYYKKYHEDNKKELIKQRDSKMEEIETKYQTEKKEKENLQLKAEKAEQAIALEKESKIKSIYAGSLIFSLLILGIYAYYYRRNKKQKRLIENLQKELHHRVKNNLTIIDSLVEDIKDDFNTPGITTRLNDLQNRIESINQVHKQLYKDNRLTELNLRKYVKNLAESIQQSFDNQKVKINNEIDDNTAIPVEKSFPLGLIINEFITNSFKYAFDKDKEGTISIKLVEKAKSFLLLLKDDGKGLPDDLNVNQLNSFGIRIMKLLSKQLGGVFSIKGENGVQVEIEFPKQ